jgi:hypothetical protein
MPSKLGIHINFITEADAMRDFILCARPAIVKTLHHDAVFWQEIKAEYPEILLIGRCVVGAQPLSDPMEEAEHMAGSILDTSTAHVYDAWEGYNEPSQSSLSPLCRFDKRLAELLHQDEVKYVAGSWAVGTPDIADWQQPEMLDTLRVADFIGVHEYCAPRMDDPRGLDADNPTQGWFVLRYRRWYPALPSDCRKPLLISECGIDSGAVHWDPGAHGGWRSFVDPEDYMSQLAWYDRILRLDSYVIGASVFCWGTLDPTWDSHDISGPMVKLLADYVTAQRSESAPSLPPPAGDPEAVRQRIAELEQKVADLGRQLIEAQVRITELEEENPALLSKLSEATTRIEEARRVLSGGSSASSTNTSQEADELK